MTDDSLRDSILRAIEAAPDPVVITTAGLDRPGPAFRYVNAAFETLSGYTRDEVVGRTPRLLQGGETDRTTTDRLRQRLEAGRPFHGQTTNYRKDGSRYVLEWRIAPVPGPDGETEAWVAVQHDVTARKRAEKAALTAAAAHISRLHDALDALRSEAASLARGRPHTALDAALRGADAVGRPEEVSHLPGGLYAALEILTAGTEGAFGFPCTFDFDCFATIGDPVRARTLAAIARETVLDAASHRPHAVHVVLSSLQPPATLSVLVRGDVPDAGPRRLPALVRLARRVSARVAVEPAAAGGYRLVCSLLS